MATLRVKSGATIFLLAHTIAGLSKDRAFNPNNDFTVDDFTESEATAVLESVRGNDFERVDESLFTLPKDKLQAKYTELSGKDPDKKWTEAKLIAAIEDFIVEQSEEAERLAQEEAEKAKAAEDEQVDEEERVEDAGPIVKIESVAPVGVIATVDAEQPKVVE